MRTPIFSNANSTSLSAIVGAEISSMSGSGIYSDGFWISYSSDGIDDPYQEFSYDTYLALFDEQGSFTANIRLNQAREGQNFTSFVQSIGDDLYVAFGDEDKMEVFDLKLIGEDSKPKTIFLQPFGDKLFEQVFEYEGQVYLLSSSFTSSSYNGIDYSQPYQIFGDIDGYGTATTIYEVDLSGQEINAALNIHSYDTGWNNADDFTLIGDTLFTVGSEKDNRFEASSGKDNVIITSVNLDNYSSEQHLIYEVNRADAIGQVFITAIGTGELVVAWNENYSDGSGMGVYYTVYDPTSKEYSDKYAASSETRGDQYISELVSHDSRIFIISGTSVQEADLGGNLIGEPMEFSSEDCPSSYKMGHQSGLSIGGSGSFA